MPIYEYKFTDTGEVIEVVQKMCDEPLKELNGREIVRTISVPNIKFTGNGFYETDYKTKN